MLNKTLNASEKEKVLQLITVAGFNAGEFSWEIRRFIFIKNSVIILNPYRYFFIFKKTKFDISAKEYFPNWSNSKNKDNTVGQQINHWLDSIRRIFARNQQIVVPLNEGSDERKNYKKISYSLGVKSQIN